MHDQGERGDDDRNDKICAGVHFIPIICLTFALLISKTLSATSENAFVLCVAMRAPVPASFCWASMESSIFVPSLSSPYSGSSRIQNLFLFKRRPASTALFCCPALSSQRGFCLISSNFSLFRIYTLSFSNSSLSFFEICAARSQGLHRVLNQEDYSGFVPEYRPFLM